MKRKYTTLCSALALCFSLSMSTVPTSAVAGEGGKNTIHGEVSDAMITTKVKAKFAMDKLLNPLDVAVSTHHGVVDLKGQVDTNTEFERAVEIAQSVDHVKDVVTDGLTVKGSTVSPTKDALITMKIKGKFLGMSFTTDHKVSPLNVSVETVDGVVTLVGDVDSEMQKEKLVSVAKSVSGVKSVESDLKIKAEGDHHDNADTADKAHHEGDHTDKAHHEGDHADKEHHDEDASE